MARLNTYGYYSLSVNKYGRSVLYPGEGPWYGGRRGDPSIADHFLYGLAYAPPIPQNFTIEFYPTTPDTTPVFRWTSTALVNEGLQYQIQINYSLNVFTSPDRDFGPFSADASSTATWWSYETPIEDVLVSSGTYYARIRATDGVIWSEWSDVLQFDLIKVSPPPPTIDTVTSPTDQFVQTITGTKTPDTHVFINNNGGDWFEVTYTYGLSSGIWSYVMTLEAGDNNIEAISSWSTSSTERVSNPVYAYIHTIFEEPEPYNVWNAFDEAGLLVSLERIAGEKNKAYKKRIEDVYENPGNSTHTGLINAISRELGIESSSVSVYRLSDLADPDYAGNLLNAEGHAIGTQLENYADEVYAHNPIFWGNLVADESVWDVVDKEYTGVSYLPHIWDPTASGIYNKWQKPGVGDQDDLWVNDVNVFFSPSGVYPSGDIGTGMMVASGIVAKDDYWRLPVHSGYFYIKDPSGVYYM